MLSSPNSPMLRRLGYGTFLLMAAAFVFLFFNGPQSLPAFREKWANVQASEKANADLRREIEEMKARNHLLRTDQEEIRLAIREGLGKQGKGEVILKLPEKQKKPTPSE
jgi:cell division protein FtsB